MTTADANDAFACWYEGLIDEGRHADFTPDVASGEERKLRLAFSKLATQRRVGKFVDVRSVPAGLRPMFVIEGVRLPFDFTTYDKLSVPADPATPFGAYVARLDGLVREATRLHADTWFGIKSEAVDASVELHTGLFTSKSGAAMLSVKLMDAPVLVDARTGAKKGIVLPSAGGVTKLAGHVVDLVLSIDDCFVRGLQLFVRWRLHALRTHGAAASTSAVTQALDAFTILDG